MTVVRDLRYRLHSLQERWFDFYHDCDTAGDASVDRSLYGAGLSGACEDYEPTPIGIVNACMKLLTSRGIDLRNLAFFDVGCGKGRVLLEAMKHRFARMEGVDVSSEMVAIARNNLASSRFIRRTCGPISIYRAKAEDVRFGEADAAIYLFHLFGQDIMRLFVDSVSKQMRAHRRKIYILYYNSLCHALFEQAGFETIARVERTPDWSHRHACPLTIYASTEVSAVSVPHSVHSRDE